MQLFSHTTRLNHGHPLAPDGGMWKVLPRDKGGTVLRDLSLHVNHGTLTGMDPATDWVQGRDGLGALSLDLVDDYIALGASPSFASHELGTITGWFNVPSGSNQRLMALGGSDTNFISYRYDTAVALVRFYAYHAGGTDVIANTTTPSLNEWHFTAVVCDGSSWTLYFDGADETTVAVGSNNGTWFADSIVANPQYSLGGGRYSSVWYPGGGYLDDVRVYSRALEPTEIERVRIDALTGRYEMLRRVGRRAYSIPAAAPGGEKYWMWARQAGAQVIGGGAV